MRSLLSFPREIGLKRTTCGSREEFDSYIMRLNGKASCYTSLYHFRDRCSVRHWKFDTDSVVIDRAWWDFDSGERGDIVAVKKDVAKLLTRLNGDVRIVATGRGFHIHELFESPVIGRDWARHLDRYEREMARGLKTLDGVGHAQKLTRIPDTFNVTRSRWAVNIDADAFKAAPLGYEIPLRPDPRLFVNDPFRGQPSRSKFNLARWVAENPIQQAIQLPAYKGPIGVASQVPIPPCLERGISVNNPSHEIRVALVQHMTENLRWFAPSDTMTNEQRDSITKEICDFIATLGWRDYNPSITLKQVRSVVNYERAPSCAWFQGRNLCDRPCWRDDGTLR